MDQPHAHVIWETLSPRPKFLAANGRGKAVEHIVRFLHDPHSPDAREIRWSVAGSLAQALTLAASEWPAIRHSHGPAAGYVIEDAGGRRVLTMPPVR